MSKKKIASLLALSLSIIFLHYLTMPQRHGIVVESHGRYVLRDEFFRPMCGKFSVQEEKTFWTKKIGSFRICEGGPVTGFYEKDGWINVEICGQIWRKNLLTQEIEVSHLPNGGFCMTEISID